MAIVDVDAKDGCEMWKIRILSAAATRSDDTGVEDGKIVADFRSTVMPDSKSCS